ncbi:MAG: Rrf2 family transcriptional regulator [Gammaproteobacteria bacterium]|nr:Rrf2 family transcriptional regulator [Gammaproteobacteria bacterium]
MKLQIASRLAIYAVLELVANPDRQMTVTEISNKFGISTHHLAKVMHTLGRAGLVRSVRGAGGGYQLSSNARRTTLLDIVELFEELGPPGADSNGPGHGSDEAAALDLVLREIDDSARATLGSITLETMRNIIQRTRTRATQ